MSDVCVVNSSSFYITDSKLSLIWKKIVMNEL